MDKIEKFPYGSPKGCVAGQSEPSSCIPACVKMILDDHGIEYPEAYLRSAMETDASGTLLSKAADCLNEILGRDLYEFKRMTISELAECRSPAIVNLRTNIGIVHALVVDSIDDDLVYIRDPLPQYLGQAYSIRKDDFREYWEFYGQNIGIAVLLRR